MTISDGLSHALIDEGVDVDYVHIHTDVTATEKMIIHSIMNEDV